MGKFNTYKKRCSWEKSERIKRNLQEENWNDLKKYIEYENHTAAERRGLRKLKKRIEKDEIVLLRQIRVGSWG